MIIFIMTYQEDMAFGFVTGCPLSSHTRSELIH